MMGSSIPAELSRAQPERRNCVPRAAQRSVFIRISVPAANGTGVSMRRAGRRRHGPPSRRNGMDRAPTVSVRAGMRPSGCPHPVGQRITSPRSAVDCARNTAAAGTFPAADPAGRRFVVSGLFGKRCGFGSGGAGVGGDCDGEPTDLTAASFGPRTRSMPTGCSCWSAPRAAQTHEGMEFLLLDMDSPGLSVLPIATIDGEREFNEVVFDGVRVPAANRVARRRRLGGRKTVDAARAGEQHDGRPFAAGIAPGTRSDGRRRRRRDWRQSKLQSRVTRHWNCACCPPAAQRQRRVRRVDAESSGNRTQPADLRIRPGTCVAMAASPTAICPRGAISRPCAASIYSGTNEIHRNLLARHLPGGLSATAHVRKRADAPGGREGMGGGDAA